MMVGFAGPHGGLISRQHESLRNVIRKLNFTSFVHGGDVGACTLAHHAVRAVKGESFPIYVLPADDRNRSMIVTTQINSNYTMILKERNQNDRDDIIAQVIHVLIVTPYIMKPGTWYIVKRARRYGVPILFVWPDGSTTIERNNEI